METPLNHTPENDEGHFLDLFIILAKYSRSILLVSAAILILTYLTLLILPNKYSASARILPPHQNATLAGKVLDSLAISASPGDRTATGISSMVAGLRTPGDLYVGMLMGNTIFDRMIDRFNLQKVYQVRNVERARKALGKRTNCEFGKDGLISIAVTDLVPKRAMEMANAFAEELNNLLLNISHTDTKKYLVFLEQERALVSQNLAKAEEALRTFNEKSGIVQIDTQTKGAIEYIGNLRATVDAKEVQIKVLQKQATPNNYDMVRLETEVKGLKDKLRSAETQTDSVGDVCIGTSKVPALGLEYLRLYREAKYREMVYQLYGKLLELAHLELASNVGNVQFVDRATIPQERTNKRMLPAVIAGLLAFFLMILISFGREYFHNLKIKEDDSERLAALRKYLHIYTQAFSRIKNLAGVKSFLKR